MLDSGKAAAAAKIYQAILDREPGNVTALMGLGDALLYNGAYDEAVDAYTKAVRIDRKSALPRLGLGRAFIQMQQPEAALERFTEASSLDSTDSRAKVGRGVALDLLGRHEEAIAEYRTVLAAQPGNRAAANNLALSTGSEWSDIRGYQAAGASGPVPGGTAAGSPEPSPGPWSRRVKRARGRDRPYRSVPRGCGLQSAVPGTDPLAGAGCRKRWRIRHDPALGPSLTISHSASHSAGNSPPSLETNAERLRSSWRSRFRCRRHGWSGG